MDKLDFRSSLWYNYSDYTWHACTDLITFYYLTIYSFYSNSLRLLWTTVLLQGTWTCLQEQIGLQPIPCEFWSQLLLTFMCLNYRWSHLSGSQFWCLLVMRVKWMYVLNTFLTCIFKGYKYCNAFLAACTVSIGRHCKRSWLLANGVHWETQSRVIKCVMLCNNEYRVGRYAAMQETWLN